MKPLQILNIIVALAFCMLALSTVYGLQKWEANEARYDQ